MHAEDLPLPGWPSDTPALRVALVSDLHIGSPWWQLDRLPELVDRINAEHPDVVLLAGDYTINGVRFGTPTPIEPIAKGLAGLRAPYGTIAVLGNHDWKNGGDRTRRALEANGVVVLENEVRVITHHGRPVNIVGFADLYERGVWADETLLDLRLGPGPVIGLIHEPDLMHEKLVAPPAILLAGHTHGGQVKLPVLGRPVVPSDYGYAAGYMVEGSQHLFVTTGVGTSIYPVRFGVPPEIAMLTLRAL